tara:strand:+ start:54 stop:353 length:300 start_codon:yes stop_codon:yes gene_type:complete
MTNPTSIQGYVEEVLTDLGVINTEADDFDRVDIGWSEAMEAIKGLIEDAVPLKDSGNHDPNEAEMLASENKEMAEYISKKLNIKEEDVMWNLGVSNDTL